jgi:hypothetical protein
MSDPKPRHRRNLFEVDNARNLSSRELVETFIPTQSFWRLLSAKNHVVLGVRGQGKTALAKMLSHDHLALLAYARKEQRAASAIRGQEFIGIYLPTRLEWVGGLNNKPWLNEKEREELFQWRLNIASCIAFLPVATSCISRYLSGDGIRARAERTLAHQLSEDWANERGPFNDLAQLRQHLEDTDYRKHVQIVRLRAGDTLREGELPVGLAFGMDLFVPLRQGIRRLARLLSINPNCAWLLCLDEAEVLDEMHHRVINSHMRAYPDNLFFKMITTPYHHYTLATNTRANLVPGQDFDYINMDSDRVLGERTPGEQDTIGTGFGRKLFKRLADASVPAASEGSHEDAWDDIVDFLGESVLLDPKREEWDETSANVALLEEYASPETLTRARRLAGTGAFRDQIARKIHGALLLRKAWEEFTGNNVLRIYSGARMAIRCSDGIPRLMIKIFNGLLMVQSSEKKRRVVRRIGASVRIPAQDQCLAIRSLSAAILNQTQALPEVGPELYEFLCMLGTYMHDDLLGKPLTTDQVSSVTIDKDTVTEREWLLVQTAVSEGFLHPNVNPGNPDEMPWKEGTFHLAFILAPHFFLLPRQGKGQRLQIIQNYHGMKQDERKAFLRSREAQLMLFDEEGRP